MLHLIWASISEPSHGSAATSTVPPTHRLELRSSGEVFPDSPISLKAPRLPNIQHQTFMGNCKVNGSFTRISIPAKKITGINLLGHIGQGFHHAVGQYQIRLLLEDCQV